MPEGRGPSRRRSGGFFLFPGGDSHFNGKRLPGAPVGRQTASNQAETEPLSLVYEGMEVPHRYRGRAHALLWAPDKSIQRNFTIIYDRESKSFQVEGYITLVSGEDGVYREEP